jgi:hypothetical protein
MKRLLTFLFVLALSVAPVAAVEANALIAGGYVAQDAINDAGDSIRDFVPTGLTGLELWWQRDPAAIGWGVGFVGAALPDDPGQTPRAGYGVIGEIGTKDAKGFGGAIYDPQAPEHPWCAVVGAAFSF